MSRQAGVFSRLIRWATRSHFSHAALIFLVPKPDDGFDSVFVIESVPSGVDITNLRHYAIDYSDAYDVAIRRLEKEWFTPDVQRLVRGRMPNFIKAEYDFATIVAIARSVLQRLMFGLRMRLSGLEPTLRRTYARGGLAPASFICSGFVQYGFIDAIRSLVREGKLAPAALDDVLFGASLTPQSGTVQILATTPEDVAATPKLAWKYVVIGRQVHPVASAADAARLLGRRAAW